MSNERRSAGAAIGLVLIHLLHSIFWVFAAELGPDEGFYAEAARRVSLGSVPYRDFGFSQGPAFAYLDAVWMQLFGFGLFEQRALSAAASTGALALLLHLLWRERGASGIVLCAMLVLAPAWYSIAHVGMPTAVAAFGLVASGAAVARRDWSAVPRVALFSFGAALAVGSRLFAAPALLLLYVGLLTSSPSGRPRVVAAVGPWLAALGISLPFLVLAPEQTWFWLVDFHVVSLVDRRGLESVVDAIGIAPGVYLLGLLALLASVTRLRDVTRACLLAAGLVAGLGPLALPAAYASYTAPGVPLLLLAAGPLAPVLTPRLVVALGIATLAGWSMTPPADPGLRAKISAAAQQLRRHTSEGQVVIASMPIVAVEADRPTHERLAMGKFGVTSDFRRARASELGLLTYRELAKMIERKDTVVVLHRRSEWSFLWSLPSLRFGPQRYLVGIERTLDEEYDVVHAGDMRIAVPRSER